MRSQHAALWVATLALLLVGAAPDGLTDDLVRQGNAAYARKDYAAAVEFYERAEERVVDPGLIAFNKGAALYRLGRYREAELSFRRCLEDGEVPGPRRLHALYDLGTSLLQLDDGKDLPGLEVAVKCLRLCRREATDSDLRERAGHNLELARLLLARAAADPANSSPRPKSEDEDHKGGKQEEPQQGETGDPTLEKGSAARKGGAQLQDPTKGEQKALETKEALAGKGNLKPLADSEELDRLDPQDIAAHLERAGKRIRGDQREQRRSGVRTLPNVKDW
jgi:tetratricopeptide (TPR) repeat protein